MTYRACLLVLFVALAGCTSETMPDDCRCIGDLPEGAVDIGCFESVCLGTVGYTCTGPGTAARDDMACFDGMDASMPDGSASDAGTPDGAVDSAVPDGAPMDSGVVDSATDTACTPTAHFADSDGDGFGDASSPADVCRGTAGYVLESGDCNDGDRNVNPDASETCDGVDTDCDGTVDPAGCAAHEGTYTGRYAISAEERLGSSVINSMHCVEGSFTITVDYGASDAVSGTATCNYPGSLGGFEHSQTATLTGTVEADGTIAGRLVHVFGSEVRDGRFTFEGAISGSNLTIEDTGSFFPNSRSAVAWQVEYELLP